MTDNGSSISGILFDKDGTLIDYHESFMPLNWRMAKNLARGDDALARHLMLIGGWDPETDRIKPGTPLAAWTLAEIAEFYHDETAIDDPAETLSIVVQASETGPAEAVAVTDLPAVLGPFKDMGLKLGITTSDHTAAARATVERFGIDGLMDFVAGYDAGYGSKPQPGMIHGFCEAFGLAPETIMVVGDNRHDIEFARAGGAGWAVGVLTGTSVREDLEPIADFVLDDITGLPGLLARL
ncbi:MAG: HAD family hydrolase [Rhodospirillales bacterium]